MLQWVKGRVEKLYDEQDKIAKVVIVFDCWSVLKESKLSE